eukprot:1550329-Prymnesium_polylepis.1
MEALEALGASAAVAVAMAAVAVALTFAVTAEAFVAMAEDSSLIALAEVDARGGDGGMDSHLLQPVQSHPVTSRAAQVEILAGAQVVSAVVAVVPLLLTTAAAAALRPLANVAAAFLLPTVLKSACWASAESVGVAAVGD